MAEERRYTFTKVWYVDGMLVVSDTMEEAVALYRQYEDCEPDLVKRVFGDIQDINPDALIRED